MVSGLVLPAISVERKGIGQEIARFLRTMLRRNLEDGLLQQALAISVASWGTGRGTAPLVNMQSSMKQIHLSDFNASVLEIFETSCFLPVNIVLNNL